MQCIALNLQGGGGTGAGNAPEGSFNAVEKILGAAVPSLHGDNSAAFSLQLSQEGATILREAFRKEGAPVGVLYNLKFTGIRPALEVKITADMKRVYDHFSASLSGQVYFVQLGIEAGIEKLKQSGALKVEVIHFTSDADRSEKERQALQLFRDTLLKDFFTPTLTPGQLMGGIGGKHRRVKRHSQENLRRRRKHSRPAEEAAAPGRRSHRARRRRHRARRRTALAPGGGGGAGGVSAPTSEPLHARAARAVGCGAAGYSCARTSRHLAPSSRRSCAGELQRPVQPAAGEASRRRRRRHCAWPEEVTAPRRRRHCARRRRPTAPGGGGTAPAEEALRPAGRSLRRRRRHCARRGGHCAPAEEAQRTGREASHRRAGQPPPGGTAPGGGGTAPGGGGTAPGGGGTAHRRRRHRRQASRHRQASRARQGRHAPAGQPRTSRPAATGRHCPAHNRRVSDLHFLQAQIHQAGGTAASELLLQVARKRFSVNIIPRVLSAC